MPYTDVYADTLNLERPERGAIGLGVLWKHQYHSPPTSSPGTDHPRCSMAFMTGDLFGAAMERRLRGRAPLAARLRPRTIGEMVGQDHLLASGRPLRELIESDRLSSVVLWGPPGVGKTTLARLAALTTASEFEELSAVNATVKHVRAVIDRARDRLGMHGTGTILFIDEVHRFNKAQQDALLPAVEDGLIVLVGATTENPHFEVNPPLMSRSTLFRLHPLDADSLTELVRRGLELENAAANDDGGGASGGAQRGRRPPRTDRCGGGRSVGGAARHPGSCDPRRCRSRSRRQSGVLRP